MPTVLVTKDGKKITQADEGIKVVTASGTFPGTVAGIHCTSEPFFLVSEEGEDGGDVPFEPGEYLIIKMK